MVGYGAYTMPDLPGLMKPEMIGRLSDNILPPLPGPKEAVEEVFINKIFNKF